MDQGLRVQDARPASMKDFNQHPKGVCRMYHHLAVHWAVGCSVHRGVLDENGRCEACQLEKRTGAFLSSYPLRETKGYPGDEYV